MKLRLTKDRKDFTKAVLRSEFEFLCAGPLYLPFLRVRKAQVVLLLYNDRLTPENPHTIHPLPGPVTHPVLHDAMEL